MRSPELQHEYDLYTKALKRWKKARGLCSWAGCQTKAGKTTFGKAYGYCAEHRHYMKERTAK